MVLAACLAAVVQAPAGLTGSVRTADGLPILGAVVTADQHGRQLTAVSGDRGDFTLPGLVLPATIEVQASRFSTVRLRVDATPVVVTMSPSTIRESLVVTAPDARESARQPTTGTTVLSGDTIRQSPAVTADEALRVVAGLSLFRRSSSRASNPTTHGVTMRGLSASGASRGLVLLDGVPLNDGFGGWVTWTRLPPLAIDTVEVDRGAQGATFGSDALGGVINVSTPRPDHSSGSMSAGFGSQGVALSDVGGSLRTASVAMQGTASWFRTDGSIPVAPESRGPVDTPADAEWVSALGKATMDSTAGRFTVSGWGSTDDRGNGTPLQRNRMSGGTVAVAWDRLVAATQLAARVSVSPNSYTQTFTTVSANRATETLTSTQFVNVTTTRAIVEAGRAVPHGYLTARTMLARAPADFTDRRPTSVIAMSLRDDSEAVAAHGAWTPTGSLTIGAGVRSEWRAAPDAAATRDAATVGSVSAAWSVGSGVVIRGSAATSHRWPTLNELVRDFRAGAVLTVANPDLLPERARSADGAVTITRAHWNLSAGAFWVVVEDAIANVTVTSAPLVRQRRNAGEAHARGLEMDFEMRPAAWARLRASTVLADSRFRHSLEPALEGNWLPQVPQSFLALSGDAQLGRGVSVSAIWRAISSQFDDDRNTFELAPAYQLDARLTGQIKAWTWYVGVDNAFNSRVEVGRTPLVTLAPPRAARAGLTWRVR